MRIPKHNLQNNYIMNKDIISSVLKTIRATLPVIPQDMYKPRECLRTISYYVESNNRVSIAQKNTVEKVSRQFMLGGNAN